MGGYGVQCWVIKVVSFSSLPLPFYTHRARGAEPRSSARPSQVSIGDMAVLSGMFLTRAGRGQLDGKWTIALYQVRVQWPAEPGNVGERREGEPDSPKEPTEAASKSASEEEASLTALLALSYHHLLLPFSGLL